MMTSPAWQLRGSHYAACDVLFWAVYKAEMTFNVQSHLCRVACIRIEVFLIPRGAFVGVYTMGMESRMLTPPDFQDNTSYVRVYTYHTVYTP